MKNSLKFLHYKFIYCILFLTSLSCSPYVGEGLSKMGNCPYQRLRFTGSSTVTSAKGVELMDSLSVAAELEKNALLSGGKLTNKLKARVAHITEEVGKFEVPISQKDANQYVKLSNSICTLQKDLYKNKIFNTPESRTAAVDLYTKLLASIDELKDKLD